MSKNRKLVIGDLVAKKPIVQGGMGVGISLSKLAGSVAKEGGIGLISTAQIGFREEDFNKSPLEANLRAIVKELKKAREVSRGYGVIGFNIMVATKGYEKYVITASAHGADIIVSGAGLAMDLPQLIQEGMEKRKECPPEEIYINDRSRVTKFAPIVSSEKSVNVILKLWDRKYGQTADMIVIEGHLAGGHLGFSQEALKEAGADTKEVSRTYKKEIFDLEIMKILSTVAEYEKKYQKHIPTVVAGGIYNHQDLKHVLELGAAGVQMGTRFVTTYECDAPLSYKQAYIASGEEDIVITESPVGMPGRAIRNSFLESLDKGRIPVKSCHDCLRKCDRVNIPYCITEALIAAASDDMEHALIFAGSNAWRATKLETVAEIMEDMMQAVEEGNI